MTPNWLNRILGHQVAPPEQAWVNIANELDKESGHIADDLKTKMLAHELPPPANVLTNIFDILDKEDAQSTPAGYIDRINEHSELAPVAAWTNIAAALDKEESKAVPVYPAKKNLRVIYVRVAAAAAVIAIVLLAILPLTKKTDPGKENLASKNAATEQGSFTNKATTTIIADTQKAAPVNSGIANNKASATNIQQPVYNYIQDYIKGNEVVDLAKNPTGSITEKLQNSKGEIPMDIALMNTPNTYISITGADGQMVKVSSKFSNLINYLALGNPDTQETIDVIIEESAKWRKIFAEWRDKMTNNTVAPSLSNFMDIIELTKILEEKNQ